MQARCLVRTLKIRTDDQGRLPRITFLLEDALRTASFPGIPPNGVVYIKRMDLGRFDSNTSRALLSRKIDAFIRNVQPVRVDSRICDQADLAAVWFADELEPYRILTEQLAKGHLPRAWFWPVAVKGWSARLTVLQSLQKIIFQAARKPTGLAGLADVLEPLLKNGSILDLFQSLSEKPIQTLVSYLGLQSKRVVKANISDAREQSPRPGPQQISYLSDGLNERSGGLIVKAVQHWGIADARSILLTALVLAQRAAAVGSGAIRRTLLQAAAQTETGRHHSPETDSSEKIFPDRTILPDPSSAVKDIPPTHTAGKKDSFATGKDRPVAVVDIQPGRTRSEALRPKDLSSRTEDLTGDERPPARIGGNAASFVARESGSDPLPRPEIISDQSASRNRSDDRNDRPRPERMRLHHPFAGRFTRFAGFPLLINVLERLGIEGIFADYPGYPVNDLRETVLWRIALWQKIPADDPAVLFLRDPADVFQRADHVHIPLTRQIVFKNARPALQDLFRFPVSRDPLTPLGLKQVADIFVLAICRYIHNLGRIAIRKLIRRPAYIAITKTHLDITAAMDSLDIRIRMAGLDVNPGWVHWLNRVIQIHYTEDDR